jgi:hypothetical protein
MEVAKNQNKIFPVVIAIKSVLGKNKSSWSWILLIMLKQGSINITSLNRIDGDGVMVIVLVSGRSWTVKSKTIKLVFCCISSKHAAFQVTATGSQGRLSYKMYIHLYVYMEVAKNQNKIFPVVIAIKSVLGKNKSSWSWIFRGVIGCINHCCFWNVAYVQYRDVLIPIASIFLTLHKRLWWAVAT